MERPLKTAVLGCGARGRAYAEYSLAHPDLFGLAAVADPVLPEDAFACRVCASWEEALAGGKPLDAAIIALPDRMHRDACLAALARGCHVLLEKPVGCTWRECLEIREAQRKSGRLVLAGYVLRYSPYYRKLRSLISSGAIGDLTSIHHLVSISYDKAAHAFCRGSWGREADGTGTLVQKCSHDFDLIDWWTGTRRCLKVSSFGALVHWRPENRPDGAAAMCSQCPPAVRGKCPFDANALYVESDRLRYHFADGSSEAMRTVASTAPYGRCVYASGNDTVDHQTTVMEYEGGLTVTLEMEGFSKRRARKTVFYGTRGEIEADGETIVLKPFSGADEILRPGVCGKHGGGDEGLMSSFLRFADKSTPERAARIFDGMLESLRIAFLAEESRKTGRTVCCTGGAA